VRKRRRKIIYSTISFAASKLILFLWKKILKFLGKIIHISLPFTAAKGWTGGGEKEFTPLQNIKGRGKVVNPFARESSCQTSEPLRTTEVPPQQPAVQQTVHVPPPVVVETVPQAAGFTPPVFTAAPRQYVHPTGRNFDSIPAILHRTPG
jgi:hypothetical protein